MKLLKLITFFIFLSPILTAQTPYLSLQVNIVDSLEMVTKTKKYKNWEAVFADTTLNGLTYQTVIRDAKGRLVKPKLANQIIRSISVNPQFQNVVYAGLKGIAGDAKVAMSMDCGNSWTYMNGGKSLSKIAEDVQTIESSPHDKDLIYAGTWKNGLFKSEDGGNTFSKIDNFPSKDVRAILYNVKNESHILVATTSHGIVETQNGGTTWEFKDDKYLDSNFKSLWNLKQSPYNPNELYALSIGKGLHKSENFGKDWKQIIDDPKMIFFGLGFKNKGEIWCSSTDFKIGKLWASKDGGNNFQLQETAIDDIIGSFTSVGKINPQFYLGGQNGLYILKNSKVQDANIALPLPSLAQLLEVDRKLLIATWGNGLIIHEE